MRRDQHFSDHREAGEDPRELEGPADARAKTLSCAWFVIACRPK